MTAMIYFAVAGVFKCVQIEKFVSSATNEAQA